MQASEPRRNIGQNENEQNENIVNSKLPHAILVHVFAMSLFYALPTERQSIKWSF